MAKKGYKQEIHIIPQYLLTIKYPIVTRYKCFECPGAYHIEVKTKHFFKIGETKKKVWVSPRERYQNEYIKERFLSYMKMESLYNSEAGEKINIPYIGEINAV